jgi:hypothetical protein
MTVMLLKLGPQRTAWAAGVNNKSNLKVFAAADLESVQ